MGVVQCDRCDSFIDLDYNCEVVCINDKFIHWECLTEDEQEGMEE